MKAYKVTIKATITKTLRVEADSEDAALEAAHLQFTFDPENGVQERYDEETLDIREVEA